MDRFLPKIVIFHEKHTKKKKVFVTVLQSRCRLFRSHLVKLTSSQPNKGVLHGALRYRSSVPPTPSPLALRFPRPDRRPLALHASRCHRAGVGCDRLSRRCRWSTYSEGRANNEGQEKDAGRGCTININSNTVVMVHAVVILVIGLASLQSRGGEAPCAGLSPVQSAFL